MTKKDITATLMAFIAIIFSGKSPAQVMDVSKLSENEKRLMIGSLYLTQCVMTGSDFTLLEKQLNKQQVRAMGRSASGSNRYYDAVARTMLYLSQDFCSVQIAAGRAEYSKFISTLPSILGVSGGKIALQKSKEGYAGTLNSKGVKFKVQAYYATGGTYSVITATMKRIHQIKE